MSFFAPPPSPPSPLDWPPSISQQDRQTTRRYIVAKLSRLFDDAPFGMIMRRAHDFENHVFRTAPSRQVYVVQVANTLTRVEEVYASVGDNAQHVPCVDGSEPSSPVSPAVSAAGAHASVDAFAPVAAAAAAVAGSVDFVCDGGELSPVCQGVVAGDSCGVVGDVFAQQGLAAESQVDAGLVCPDWRIEFSEEDRQKICTHVLNKLSDIDRGTPVEVRTRRMQAAEAHAFSHAASLDQYLSVIAAILAKAEECSLQRPLQPRTATF